MWTGVIGYKHIGLIKRSMQWICHGRRKEMLQDFPLTVDIVWSLCVLNAVETYSDYILKFTSLPLTQDIEITNEIAVKISQVSNR